MAMAMGPEAGAVPQILEEVKRRWKLLLALGILLVITGVACILAPEVASVATTTVAGWFLLIAGVFALIEAFAVRSAGRIVLRLLMAVLMLLAAGYILSSPLDGTLTLTVVLMWYFIVSGVLQVVAGIRERGAPSSGMLVVSGILSAILGLLVWRDLPDSAAWAIGLLVGVHLVFRGMELVLLALAGRRAARG